MKSDRASNPLLSMNPLQRALIEKAGHDNGFEYVLLPSETQHAVLASARHPARVRVAVVGQEFEARIDSGSSTLAQELERTFATRLPDSVVFVLPTEALLAQWLRRAAALSQALPNQAVTTFEQRVQAELAQMSGSAVQNTEVLRTVRQRVGQQAYRQAMLDYWGGACAVTGLALPPVLRASHAKPWALCDNDAERLDVFNGFLLAVHLDALFDQFWLSFDAQGHALISSRLNTTARDVLGLSPGMRVRWIALEHQPYMNYHRSRFFMGEDCKGGSDAAGACTARIIDRYATSDR